MNIFSLLDLECLLPFDPPLCIRITLPLPTTFTTLIFGCVDVGFTVDTVYYLNTPKFDPELLCYAYNFS